MTPPAAPLTDEPALPAHLPLPWAQLRSDGSVCSASAAFEALFGAVQRGSADAGALGDGWLAGLAPAQREQVLASLAGCETFECSLSRPDATGAPRWLDLRGWRPPGSASWLCLVLDDTASHVRERHAVEEVAQFRLLANNVPVLIAYYDTAASRCRFANRLYARTFGLDERTILGRTVVEVIGEAAAAEIQPYVDHVVQHQRSVEYERELVAPGGERHWLEVHLLPHVGHASESVGVFVLISDVTKRKRAEQTVRDSEERLAKFMHASMEGIAFHRDGLVTDVNPPLLRLLGYSLDEMLGRSILDFIAPDYREQVHAVMVAGQELTYESVGVRKDGTRLPLEFVVRTTTLRDERQRMTIVHDLRDRQAAQARIHYLAHHDALTGLPNRGAFLERADSATQHADARGGTLALLFVDIDHFKRVNDSLGHLAGDTLLQIVARRITGALRATDLVARFAGDEFVVLLGGDQQAEQVREVASKLLAVIESPVDVDGRAISVTPSIGVALYPQDGATSAELLKHADTAMYHAKARGRAQCCFFEPAMARAAYAALVLESELVQALQLGQFELHYQPQWRLSDRSMLGCEALLRWHHPQRGLVGPDEFIPVAEERRLMLGVGRWVLEEAVRQAAAWRRAGLAVGPVGVNLSTMQFEAPGFVESVEALLAAHGLDGEVLELELTERMLMDDLPSVRRRLERLRELGIRIAVDDFGTGFTSLAHLKDLPVDRLKIDSSFVEGLPADAGSAAVADAIVRMARGLGLRVVAEGVETPAQQRWLALHGCDEVQGRLVAGSMDATAFEAWLRSATGTAASMSR